MRRSLPALFATVSGLAVVLGLLPAGPPAGAAASPTAPWISGQSVQANGTVNVTLNWDPAPGASSYTLYMMKGEGEPIVVGKPVDTTPGTQAVVPRLEPQTTYCFALMANSAAMGSPRACKVTPPVSRAVVPTAVQTTVATYNVSCGAKSRCNSGWKWKKRQKKVVANIRRMNADVMVFVEGHLAHKYGKKKRWIGKVMKKRGYQPACQTQKSKKRKLFSQTAYVRASTYAVVGKKRNSKGSRFTMFGDRNHGYCHALIQHRASGKPVAIAALHLRDGRVGADDKRRQESAYVLGQLTTRFPGVATVLLGDFNSHRGLDRRGQVDTPRLVMEAAGFADAVDIAQQLTYPYLNSAHGFEVNPPRSTTWPTHVDRIFVSPGITVPSWENIAVLDGPRYATPMASDHNPVRATLYLP